MFIKKKYMHSNYLIYANPLEIKIKMQDVICSLIVAIQNF